MCPADNNSCPGERVWNAPTLRSTILSAFVQQWPEGILPLNKDAFSDMVAHRYQHFDHWNLVDLKKRCRDPERLSIYLGHVRRLDRQILTHADFRESLDIYPNVREFWRLNRRYLALLPGRRALFTNFIYWSIDMNVDNGFHFADHRNPLILSPPYEVQVRNTVTIIQTPQEAENRDARDELGQRLAGNIKEYVTISELDEVVELNMLFGVEVDAVLAILYALQTSKRGRLSVDCRDFTIEKQQEVVRAAGPELQSVIFQKNGGFSLKELLSAPDHIWTGCEGLKSLGIAVHDDRFRLIPTSFQTVDDFMQWVDAVSNTGVSNHTLSTPESDQYLLPNLDSLSITFCGPTVESQFSPGDDVHPLDQEDSALRIEEELWRVARLDESELQGLERLVGPTCTVRFDYAVESINFHSFDGLWLENRLNNQVEDRRAQRL